MSKEKGRTCGRIDASTQQQNHLSLNAPRIGGCSNRAAHPSPPHNTVVFNDKRLTQMFRSNLNCSLRFRDAHVVFLAPSGTIPARQRRRQAKSKSGVMSSGATFGDMAPRIGYLIGPHVDVFFRQFSAKASGLSTSDLGSIALMTIAPVTHQHQARVGAVIGHSSRNLAPKFEPVMNLTR